MNWKIAELQGSRESVAAEIKANAEIPDFWKAAIISEIAIFMPQFNGIRVDAHCHELASAVPLSPVHAAAEIKKSKEEKREPVLETVNGGIFSIHISLKPLKLSVVPAS